jgi:hypothetical protein
MSELMMRRPPSTLPWLDRLGMATGTLCAVHCAATALLLGTLSALGVAGIAAPWVESTFLTASVVLGIASLAPAMRRHRSFVPLLGFSAGLALLLGVRPVMPTPPLEVLAVAGGASFVVWAHWRNARMMLRARVGEG